MKRNGQLLGPPSPPSKRAKVETRTAGQKTERTEELAGPPGPPTKCAKIEKQPTGPNAMTFCARTTSLANQNDASLIFERSEINKEDLELLESGDIHASESHSGTTSQFNQSQQVSLRVPNQQRVRRCDLIDFFLRETDAGSCKDVLSFLADSDLVETVIVPGAKYESFKYLRKASDVLKHIVQKMTNYFSDLQLVGWSFCGKVDISDILVTPLGDIRMIRSKSLSLKPESPRRNRKDFRCVFRMLMKILERVERIPEDLLHLLILLKNFVENERVLVTQNPGTMTEQERLSLLDKLYRSYEALADNDDRLNAITDGVPYGNEKKKGHYLVRAKTNVFLIEMLEHRNALWLGVPAKNKERPTYPPTGRGELKLNRNSMQHAYKGLAIEKLLEPGNVLEDNDQNKDDEPDKKKSKKKKRRLSKKKRKNLPKPIRAEKFKPFQVDHILGRTFPGLLCAFAKLMNDAGLYEEVIQALVLPAPGEPVTRNQLEPEPDNKASFTDLNASELDAVGL